MTKRGASLIQEVPGECNGEKSEMGITVVWDDEAHTAFHWIFEGQWTWKEYYAAMYQSNAMARTVNYPIDVIVDLQASKVIPSHVFSNIRAETADQPEKMGMIAVVGANAFVNALLNTLRRVSRRLQSRLFTANSPEEARALLQKYRTQKQQSKPG
jgi:hypothetical protein